LVTYTTKLCCGEQNIAAPEEKKKEEKTSQVPRPTHQCKQFTKKVSGISCRLRRIQPWIFKAGGRINFLPSKNLPTPALFCINEKHPKNAMDRPQLDEISLFLHSKP